MRESASGTAGYAGVVAATTAIRAARPALVWGVLFGLLIANEALTYRSTFPTAASRQEFAASFGGNAGLSAVIGPGRQLDTIEGVVAWRMFGLMLIVGAVWGLLTATKLLRGEEDSGRWELLLSGRTSRRHATVQALVGLGVGWLVLWVVTASITVVVGSRATVGFSISQSVFYALAGTASAAVFLAVGALASQLAGTRRQANGIAATVFGVAYLIRLLADAGLGLEGLRWASPLGWIENVRPLTDPRPWAFLPVAGLVVGVTLATVGIAGRRDVGVAAWSRRRGTAPGLAAVTRPASPWSLAWYLERWVVVAWIVGLGLLAMVFGITAGVAADAGFGSNVDETVGRLGGRGGVMEAWVGYEFLYLAAILAFAAATQIASLRDEEAEGHVDNLLVRPVTRSRWLLGRLTVGATLVVGSGAAVAVGGWAGVSGHGIGIVPMLEAGLSTAVPGLVVLGLGALIYGTLPRLAAPSLYLLVLWSFLVETFGTSLTDNQAVLDTSMLTHLGPVPAADLNTPAVLAFLGSALALTALGLLGFRRRDLSAA